MTGCEDHLRTLCLALPEAVERYTFGGPTFRVGHKIFALYTTRNGRPSTWLKAPPGSQAVLVGADKKRFFVPPYLGSKGWVGVRLDTIDGRGPDMRELTTLVQRSYRLVAPRRLSALLA